MSSLPIARMARLFAAALADLTPGHGNRQFLSKIYIGNSAAGEPAPVARASLYSG
jgi:hypothetical protein